MNQPQVGLSVESMSLAELDAKVVPARVPPVLATARPVLEQCPLTTTEMKQGAEMTQWT